MTGEWPKIVDHNNHIGIDNRWENLNNGTISDNTKNISKQKNNTSGITGVHFNKEKEKWQAFIWDNYKFKHIKYCDSIEEASLLRKQAEIKYGYHENHGK